MLGVYLTHGYLVAVVEGRQHNGGGIEKHGSLAPTHYNQLNAPSRRTFLASPIYLQSQQPLS